MIEVERKLDSVLEEIKAGGVYQAIHRLHATLKVCRDGATNGEWQTVVNMARSHELCSFVHRCPISHRSYYKPRGYPGDAELLDLIYGVTAPTDTDEIAEQARQANLATPAARGVQARRGSLADLVTEVTVASKSPRLLSVAAGHLREIALCSPHILSAIEEWIALDQDEISLAEIRRCYPYPNVRPYKSTIKRLILGDQGLGAFDLIYAAGLYDYLKMPTAQKLTSTLFQMLRPGGALLVANYLPTLPNIGYMECYMDWYLTYRTMVELEEFAEVIKHAGVRYIRTFSDADKGIGYLQLCRV